MLAEVSEAGEGAGIGRCAGSDGDGGCKVFGILIVDEDDCEAVVGAGVVVVVAIVIRVTGKKEERTVGAII